MGSPEVPMYRYLMLELPVDFTRRVGEGLGTASAKLEKMVNSQAREGWEFYRTDLFDITETIGRGCIPRILAMIGGMTRREFKVYVVTFRRPVIQEVNNSVEQSPSMSESEALEPLAAPLSSHSNNSATIERYLLPAIGLFVVLIVLWFAWKWFKYRSLPFLGL